LAEANLVTICIGANDILYPAEKDDFNRIKNYIIDGEDVLKNTIEPEIEKNLRTLDGLE
jgi:lysophospholipase L1-like esterase